MGWHFTIAIDDAKHKCRIDPWIFLFFFFFGTTVMQVLPCDDKIRLRKIVLFFLLLYIVRRMGLLTSLFSQGTSR